MKAVKIADLKSRLSHHLRRVRAGESVTVLDRQTPIARIVPVEEADDIVITKPASDAPTFSSVKMPPPVKLDFDVIDLLLEDRLRR
jgi:prevent-host-death family protein